MPKEVSLPKDIDPYTSVDNFGNLFVQKVEDINNKIRGMEVELQALPFIATGDTHIHTLLPSYLVLCFRIMFSS